MVIIIDLININKVYVYYVHYKIIYSYHDNMKKFKYKSGFGKLKIIIYI